MDKIVSHYHITFSNISADELIIASKSIKAKPTTIDLVGATKELQDRMATKYQKGNGIEQMVDDVGLLKDSGYTIKRFKLEQMLDDLSPETISQFAISNENYIEVHVKVEFDTNLIDVEGFQHSHNPKENTHFFYNARARTAEEVGIIRNGIQKLEDSHLNVKSAHFEYTVFDSDSEHDSWWL